MINKTFKIFLLSSPIIVSSSSIAIYYLVNKNKESVQKNDEKKTAKIDSINGDYDKNIFPDITFDEVYDEIVMENNEPIINDQMIAKFIKIVFMRINTSYGKIKVEISRLTKVSVEIKFSWIVGGIIKEYKIYKMILKF